jgi:hypothetical protein
MHWVFVLLLLVAGFKKGLGGSDGLLSTCQVCPAAACVALCINGAQRQRTYCLSHCLSPSSSPSLPSPLSSLCLTLSLFPFVSFSLSLSLSPPLSSNLTTQQGRGLARQDAREDAGLTFLDRWLRHGGGRVAGTLRVDETGRADGAPAGGGRGLPLAKAQAPGCQAPAVQASQIPAPPSGEARTHPRGGENPPPQRGRAFGGVAAQLLVQAAREGNLGMVERMMQVTHAHTTPRRLAVRLAPLKV